MKSAIREHPWLAVIAAILIGAVLMYVLSWGWLRASDSSDGDLAAPAADQPAQTRLCLGLGQITDGVARARIALAANDSPGLRLAARSMRQGYNDAQDASGEVDGADVSALTEPVRTVSDLASASNATRQAASFTAPLDAASAEAAAIAGRYDCLDRLAGG